VGRTAGLCPGGTGDRSQAIYCLATFIKSLRDKRHLTPVDEFGARSTRSIEDEDEDEYDDEIGYSATESRLAATTGSVVIERSADCKETGSRMEARINNPWRVQSRAKLRVNAPAKSAGV
jgi:hypothetical protein